MICDYVAESLHTIDSMRGIISANPDTSESIWDGILAEQRDSADEKISKEMVPEKMLRVRSRLTGAVSLYCTLTDTDIDNLLETPNYKIFRTMWSLGDCQDDLIDTNKCAEAEQPRELTRSLFPNPFYTSTLRYIVEEINSGFHGAQAHYLRVKLSDWYRSLAVQEMQVLCDMEAGMDYSFDYCKNYRETQNASAGALLIAFLNGGNCLDPRYQKLEEIIPIFSFRTQIIDDLQDAREDLEQNRPNYLVGALNENPDEKERFMRFLQENPDVVKVCPTHIRKYAPKSFRKVKDLFDQFGNDLSEKGVSYDIYRKMGDVLFNIYPFYRDFVFKVRPPMAAF